MSHHAHHHPTRHGSTVAASAVAIPMPPVLGANVLVRNTYYRANRGINSRRALSVPGRALAEVWHCGEAVGEAKRPRAQKECAVFVRAAEGRTQAAHQLA